ncbi:LolA-like protein [Streptomyces apocyni]|uniref:hypothetical protein n=1 Tax=Streptomyces apocyni TaxID=2654677 RepID=UPI001E532911|nr:hypothetical protein [Streptomyces apocyni]
MKMRTLVACAAAVTIAAGATACGSDSVKETAEGVKEKAGSAVPAALLRATTKTDKMGSAEVSMATDLGNGQPISMDGTYTWGDGLGFDVEMDAKASGMQALVSGDTVRSLFVDGSYYYKVNPQPSGPLQGKQWMKIDASAVMGDEASANLQSQNADPTAGLRGIKHANDVENLGEETVGGRKATHYKAALPQTAFGLDNDSAMGQLAGNAEIDIEIWVDGKDLPVRIKQKMGAMTVTMDFEKFGAAKKITAPPAAETGDVTDEVKAGQGGAQGGVQGSVQGGMQGDAQG